MEELRFKLLSIALGVEKILPKDLRNEWFNIIENMNFDPDDPLIPIKFLSEELWIDLNEKK